MELVSTRFHGILIFHKNSLFSYSRPTPQNALFPTVSATLGGYYREKALFSLSLQRNAVMMTLFSRSITVDQLPVAIIEPSWQVNHGFWESAGFETYQKYCQ
jgi:hypothetical protein